MRLICWSETSVINYRPVPRNIPEGLSHLYSHLVCGYECSTLEYTPSRSVLSTGVSLSSTCSNKLSKTRISRLGDNVAEGNKDLSERSHIRTHYPCTAAVVSVYNQYTYSNSGTCHEMNPVRRTRSLRNVSPVFLLNIIKYGSVG